jgi:REP element-mobilizing transposase RayT
MPRHLRHHTPGGWYHITTRGLGRRAIFHTDRDREHFIELLEGLVERYKGKGVVIRHRTKKMLHIQFDLIDATIPRQLGNDEMFSMKIAS